MPLPYVYTQKKMTIVNHTLQSLSPHNEGGIKILSTKVRKDGVILETSGNVKLCLDQGFSWKK